MKREAGFSLLETIAALALLGIISAVFLGALATSSNSRALADEHVSARILAESQMEHVRQLDYASSYEASPAISAKYPGYSTAIDVENMRNGHIQKVTITVSHRNSNITVLESYKARRTNETS
jgi:prepilin-type N-terminal cleavage/methylation domain-containing protein